MYTDISGYEHLIEKDINNKEITYNECGEMIKNKMCSFGVLKKGEHSYHTNNKIGVEYPNRFTSIFRSKRYIKENCFLIETKVFSHYQQEHPVNIRANMDKCNYLSGKCQIKSNEIMIWEVNNDQNCKFISIGIFDGYYNDNFWINDDNQIALNIINKIFYDCNKNLKLTSQGYALKLVQNNSRRGKRSASTFQEAGEFQYLGHNITENLKRFTKIYCQMFNDHNEILEILLSENPKKFIQKTLNYSALDVNLLSNNILEVKFCKEIKNDQIQFTDLSDVRGYIPIKIKKYSDRIWYLKNGVIIDEIELNNNSPNISDTRSIEIMRNYDLEFLKKKIIFKEHIFDDIKTNIEEELLKEIQHTTNVEIEIEENEQRSMIPHEIIADFDSFLETYYIKYWRIYVTIGVTLFYIFIIRALIYIISPLFSLTYKSISETDKKEKSVKFNKESEHLVIEENVENIDRKSNILKSFRGKSDLRRKANLPKNPSIASLEKE
jgi:hypothetical protein